MGWVSYKENIPKKEDAQRGMVLVRTIQGYLRLDYWHSRAPRNTHWCKVSEMPDVPPVEGKMTKKFYCVEGEEDIKHLGSKIVEIRDWTPERDLLDSGNQYLKYRGDGFYFHEPTQSVHDTPYECFGEAVYERNEYYEGIAKQYDDDFNGHEYILDHGAGGVNYD